MIERRSFLRACIAGIGGMVVVPKLGSFGYRKGSGLWIPVDDTEYVQNYVDLYRSVPHGSYRVSRPIHMPNAPVSFNGSVLQGDVSLHWKNSPGVIVYSPVHAKAVYFPHKDNTWERWEQRRCYPLSQEKLNHWERGDSIFFINAQDHTHDIIATTKLP